MENLHVYAVFYDNCQAYEDHRVDLVSIHISMEGAKKYVDELTSENAFKCMSKEEYYNQPSYEIHYSYEDYYEIEYDNWLRYNSGEYHISSRELRS